MAANPSLAQVGVHTDFPDASSAMDIQATNRGLLIPRVTLTGSLSDPSPVTSPAVGLLVFNNGANQPFGFYYWSGSLWVAIGGGGTDFWSLTGNAGTNPSANYIGTSDGQHLVVRTNATERMRFESDGQILSGLTTPNYADDFFTISGNAVQDYALNVYSPYAGVYAHATNRGFYSDAGQYGLLATLNHSSGYAVYARNYNATGHGMITAGANADMESLINHKVGINANGNDGIFAKAHLATGTGVLALGNSLETAYFLSNGSGGAFTGLTGIYAHGGAANGIGIIGVGNNNTSYAVPADGCGGSFTGFHGVYASAKNTAGIGVTALGSNSSTYFTSTNGLGGSVAGYHGIIALGNSSTEGIGMIGVGNNLVYSLPSNGCGGAFYGTTCGVYGYAAAESGDRYGGYFETGGGGYAYVGVRYGTTNRKIVGNGNVQTIVRNTKGERVALTCPEAPESLFMDFGTGQLMNGRTHISIDPDLSINILVDEQHPLKVYVTLEGECNGVYVTNKSASGFDVVELQGGQSHAAFSWQVVATRATEEFVLADGSIEISDYSERFPPAPPPMEAKMAERSSMEVMQYQAAQKSAVENVEDIKPREE